MSGTLPSPAGSKPSRLSGPEKVLFSKSLILNAAKLSPVSITVPSRMPILSVAASPSEVEAAEKPPTLALSLSRSESR